MARKKDKEKQFDESIDSLIGIDNVDDLLDDDEQEEYTQNFEMVEYEEVTTTLTEEDVKNKDFLDDYQFARSVSRGLVQRGMAILEGAMKMTKAEDHPRNFEVCASLMKNISDNTKELMALHEKVSGGNSGAKKEATTVNNTQNNYYSTPKNEQEEIGDMLDGLDEE